MTTIEMFTIQDHEYMISKYGQDYTESHTDKEVHEQESDWCLHKAFSVYK